LRRFWPNTRRSRHRSQCVPSHPGNGSSSVTNRSTNSEITALISTLEPKADCVDQSHGRVRIRVSGAKVEQMLAKGTAVDLAPIAFPLGHATTTLIGHVAAHITRTDSESFEIIVLRGFAESLWDDLETMGREFV
jgi:sarcosine oxidase subunit gamma